jgi:hypothetical protein
MLRFRRFRNRFTDNAMPSELGKCKACGVYVTRSVVGGRETMIHELPWCQSFRDLVTALHGVPGTELHMAVGTTDRQTVIIADGDTVADVDVGKP